jgi:transcription initiation factor TFIIIB Brf1 subunit/transcription initiation factor TFIIB
MALRQQAMATAQLYIRRFYSKVEIRTTNPYLVIATAVYLACKMEECPQHIRLVVSEARSHWPGIQYQIIRILLRSNADRKFRVHQPKYIEIRRMRILLDLRVEFPINRSPSISDPHRFARAVLFDAG